MVILDPLGRWRSPERKSPDWSPEVGGRLGQEGGRPASSPVRSPLASRGFWSLLDVR